MSSGANVEELLSKLATHIKSHADPYEHPMQFVRDVHRQWKEDGGKLAGKPRHSDRYVDDRLKDRGQQVRSLTPKLTGKTNIAPEDAAALLRVFLSEWPEAGASEEEVVYEPLLENETIEEIVKVIQDSMRSVPASRVALPVIVEEHREDDTLPGRTILDVITEYYRECNAMITVAPEQILVASGPKKELVGFRDLMDFLRSIDTHDNKGRALIWVLDLGGPKLDDYATRIKYLNVQALITRFKALAHYKDENSEERYRWLKSRGVILLLDTYGDWGGELKLSNRPDFFQNHLTMSQINTFWASNSNFRTLYGSNLDGERVKHRVFNIFYNASEQWEDRPNLKTDLRNFGYASFKVEPNKEETEGRGLELPPLALRNANAHRTVCAAASHVLNLKVPPSKELEISGGEAVAQLEYLGFRVLSIDEFVEWY